MNTVGERIAEDWACGRLTGTVAEQAIDEACAKAKAFARKPVSSVEVQRTLAVRTVFDLSIVPVPPETGFMQG